MRKYRKIITDDYRREILRHAELVGVTDAADTYSVSKAVIYKWREEMRKQIAAHLRYGADADIWHDETDATIKKVRKAMHAAADLLNPEGVAKQIVAIRAQEGK